MRFLFSTADSWVRYRELYANSDIVNGSDHHL